MSDNIITFGCRLNTYESEAIREALAKSGSTQQTIVFNSCAVTKEAERQLRQSIRKKRKEFPDARLLVTGCAAQINPKAYADMKEVDGVLGNEEKFNPEHYQDGAFADKETVVSSPLEEKRTFSKAGVPNAPELSWQPYDDAKIKVNDIMSVEETASHMISSFEGRTRAFVQVQNGCNHRCTFCIIPYGRGNSRSVPMGEIVQQVKLLVTSGYQEVVLTGVDISDYGSDLPGKPTLGQMMKRLLNLVPELPRLRLSSIDVAEVDADIMQLIAEEKRLMPYMHISLQAGDDMILKRMKRRHTREQVIEFCKEARKLRPEITFGADIIAGFPTEDEEMFQNTLNLVHEAGLTFLHVFPYSEREGTPAAKMPQLPMDVRKQRAARLREAGDKELNKLLMKNINKVKQVIIEKDNVARSEDFFEVKIDKTLPVGSIVHAMITGHDGHYLLGQVNA